MSYGPEFDLFDNSSITQFVFHPRKDLSEPPPNAVDHMVVVEPGVAISTRLYRADIAAPTILYFHGNGEVVSDHDYLAPAYTGVGINLFVVDYRGYGASGGTPTFRSLFTDAPLVLKAVNDTLRDGGFSQDLFVMGRSLGSAPASELAANHPGQLRGLIIESGFASATRLLRYLGLSVQVPDDGSLPNLSNIRRVKLPSLVIHGEFDNLIPISEAEELFANLPVQDKRMLVIRGADHNDILYVGAQDYFQAVANFVFAHCH